VISASAFEAQRDTVTLDRAYREYFELKPKVMDTKYAIGWKPEYYYFPIPKSALDNNPLLIQNIGWGGNFEPAQ